MNKAEDTQLYRIRHSLAHVLAQAVLEIRPEAKLGFGPPVENGFYYDFDLEDPLSPEDLPEIEKRMKKIIKSRQTFECEELNGEEMRITYEEPDARRDIMAMVKRRDYKLIEDNEKLLVISK